MKSSGNTKLTYYFYLHYPHPKCWNKFVLEKFEVHVYIYSFWKLMPEICWYFWDKANTLITYWIIFSHIKSLKDLKYNTTFISRCTWGIFITD